jgi:hypothetical protein
MKDLFRDNLLRWDACCCVVGDTFDEKWRKRRDYLPEMTGYDLVWMRFTLSTSHTAIGITSQLPYLRWSEKPHHGVVLDYTCTFSPHNSIQHPVSIPAPSVLCCIVYSTRIDSTTWATPPIDCIKFNNNYNKILSTVILYYIIINAAIPPDWLWTSWRSTLCACLARLNLGYRSRLRTLAYSCGPSNLGCQSGSAVCQELEGDGILRTS